MVPAAPDNFAVPHDDRAERPAAIRPHLGPRKRDGRPHEFNVHREILNAAGAETMFFSAKPFAAKDGGAWEARTPDPHNAIVVLYQLS